jgi:hypothetical protein
MSAARTLAAILFVTAAGCWMPPSPTTKPDAAPSRAEDRPTLSVRSAAASPISAEVLSAEVRPVKATHALAGNCDGPVCLIVRVRFSIVDDTIDTRRAVFSSSSAVDEFGNRMSCKPAMITTMMKVAEPEGSNDMTPGTPAVRTFVFDAPIPKATTATLTASVMLNRDREPRFEFPFTVALPAR